MDRRAVGFTCAATRRRRGWRVRCDRFAATARPPASRAHGRRGRPARPTTASAPSRRTSARCSAAARTSCRSAGTACGTRRRRAGRAGTCCRVRHALEADAPTERRVADAAARLRPGVAGAVAVAGGGEHRTLHRRSTNAAARRSACRRSLRCQAAAARTRGTRSAADRKISTGAPTKTRLAPPTVCAPPAAGRMPADSDAVQVDLADELAARAHALELVEHRADVVRPVPVQVLEDLAGRDVGDADAPGTAGRGWHRRAPHARCSR